MLVRKHRAGSDSFGNVWKRPGDVIEVDDEQAAQLVVMPGFEEVPRVDDDHDDTPDSDPGDAADVPPVGPEGAVLSEAPAPEVPAKRAPGRPKNTPKVTEPAPAAAVVVEE